MKLTNLKQFLALQQSLAAERARIEARLAEINRVLDGTALRRAALRLPRQVRWDSVRAGLPQRIRRDVQDRVRGRGLLPVLLREVSRGPRRAGAGRLLVHVGDCPGLFPRSSRSTDFLPQRCQVWIDNPNSPDRLLVDRHGSLEPFLPLPATLPAPFTMSHATLTYAASPPARSTCA